MSGITRRDFLAGMGAAGALALTARPATAAEPKPKKGTDLVTLGRSGLRCSLLGIGTGTHAGRDHLKLGQNGFTAVLETGGSVVPKSVDFRGFGGFTGTYWADNIGDAEVTGVDGEYTITGSAAGNFVDDPMNEVTAKFRIEADC